MALTSSSSDRGRGGAEPSLPLSMGQQHWEADRRRVGDRPQMKWRSRKHLNAAGLRDRGDCTLGLATAQPDLQGALALKSTPLTRTSEGLRHFAFLPGNFVDAGKVG